MRKEDLEIAILTSERFLLTFFDIAIVPFFFASSSYRKPIGKYIEESGYEKEDIKNRIQYLKRIKCIRVFTEGKEKYIELLPKGIKRLDKAVSEHLRISKPKIWDKKWRVIIFDVPEKERYARDGFRLKLREWGFVQIQKSVYVFPFPCTDEITYLSQKLHLEKYVTIMLSEIIQGEENILDQFVQKGTLDKKDLR